MAILPVGIGPQEGGYQIERSLRFNSADSAYLNRTPASAGNKKTFTISLWIKRSALGATTALLDGDSSDGNRGEIYFDSSDRLNIYDFYAASGGLQIWSARVFRDIGAWYHIVFAFDTTQATDSNRLKIYINGVQESLAGWSVGSGASRYPTQNADFSWNGATSHWIGRTNSGSAYFNGYITEFHNIDGQALDPTSFGEFNSDTGVWQPKAYTGSYGTNGFYLDFADNSSTTALGYDAAGSNDWTPNNFSVTAGAGNDSLVDTPTPYGTDTGVGGEVRGNYCTWNPVNGVTASLTNGNLDLTYSSAGGAVGTMAFPSSGKWYWEVTVTGGGNNRIGICLSSLSGTDSYNVGTGTFLYVGLNGNKYTNGSASSYGATYTTNDIIGVAVDADAGTVVFYKNNSSQGTAFSGLSFSTSYSPTISVAGSGASMVTNFGQRPFAYTAPSGFKALCTQNLPEPTVVDGGNYFNAVLWTGNGSTQTITTGIANDLVWTKDRGAAYDHTLFDVIRTPGYFLRSNATSAEEYRSDSLTAFTSTGFSVGADSVRQNINKSGNAYVSWAWKAGGTGVTNTAGSITSTVSANPTAGFSIVTFTMGSSGTNFSMGHGLNSKPAMIIYKNRGGNNWQVAHQSLGNMQDYYITLNSTGGSSSSSAIWYIEPTLTLFGISTGVYANSSNVVAYCFAPVEGYSAFGKYTGNGSSDGPFVFTNMRSRFLLVKRTDSADDWVMYDSARDTYNQVVLDIRANSSAAEASASSDAFDFLSNGFKLRGTTYNASGGTYIYAAFAENPFKYSLAR